ncbi:Glutamate N-acetyltransferase @ N-acetylglutamate synthase [hydrothermal vent metagenome]|uniref:Glutamate N-acetyltransferase @ N-acetylglutamate synthase n=1 Tax=hydrothermal vent metagenome TaxID=652676 RepID=A0A3B0S6W6_9ZZZZ
MNQKTSPLAPVLQPDLPVIAGVQLAVAETGIKYQDRADLMLVLLPAETTVAGCFTTSKTASAPVELCRTNLDASATKNEAVRAIIVNAGNANAFTGKKGKSSTEKVCNMLAERLGCSSTQIYMASTGVIGEPLDPGEIIGAIDDMVANLRPDIWLEAAQAIMTTDTFAKQATVQTEIRGKPVTINGFAKGSGMIAPDMATMLAFLFTDASLPQDIMQALLTDAVEQSFNAITVDSDTSTSDTVLMCATGQEKPGFQDANDPDLEKFRMALNALTRDLAHQIVRDGEGAEKFITIRVTGAENHKAARKIGLTIANSPLVKTAIAGEDANWGRIVMAVGKAGEKANRDALSINIGGIQVASAGEADKNYNEQELIPHMQGREIDIAVDVGIANGHATVWTCDLTHRYIEINADYRS